MIFFVSSFAKGRQIFYNSVKFDLFTIKIRTNTDVKRLDKAQKKVHRNGGLCRLCGAVITQQQPQ